MVFTITPKRTIHEIFGCHDKTTIPYQHQKGKDTSFSKDGFHCACEQLEFQTAFIDGFQPLFDLPDLVFNRAINTGFIHTLHAVAVVLHPLRGPPAFV